MNDTQPVVLSPDVAPLHCQHRSASGRRFCRMPVSDPATGLCFKHAAQLKKERDAANVAALLIRDTDDFTSAVTINRSLTELYKLLARDEISPRRAAVMAYTCSLLLRTLPAIELELHPPDEPEQIIFDVPRPNYDDDTSPERAMVNRWADRCAPVTPVEPDGPDDYDDGSTPNPDQSK